MTSTLRPDSADLLRELLPAGSTVYTNLRHVSASGMSRAISVHVVTPGGDIRDISWHVSHVTSFNLDPKHEGLRVGGVGMDMGFHVVYALSRALYAEGYKCTGTDGWIEPPTAENGYSGKKSKRPACPSTEHSHDTTPNYSRRRTHKTDAGYALEQRWI